jgi:hypothetical protein
MDDDLFSFWQRGDRAGFISHAATHKWTRARVRPAANVASRWFNYMTNVMESAGDTWLHYDGSHLWWTVTDVAEGWVEANGPRSPKDRGIGVWVVKKAARPWTNLNLKGNRLDWNTIHGKAKDFLVPQSTQATLSEDNARYALTLIEGGDLSGWHNLADWTAKISGRSSKQPGTIHNARERSILTMVFQVTRTTASSNGQEVVRRVKNKDLLMSEEDLVSYVRELLDQQEDRCAISDLPLQFQGTTNDPEMLCSLDRIDSDGHYERGNLQVVCRFINRWKSDSVDAEFRRLLGVLRE